MIIPGSAKQGGGMEGSTKKNRGLMEADKKEKEGGGKKEGGG